MLELPSKVQHFVRSTPVVEEERGSVMPCMVATTFSSNGLPKLSDTVMHHHFRDPAYERSAETGISRQFNSYARRPNMHSVLSHE
jgi:hypothetical protein